MAQEPASVFSVHHERVETGCFVYQVVRKEKVLLRSCPEVVKEEEDEEVEEEESHFELNELLAVDLIQPGSHATFLRLADQSGWVIAEKGGEIYLRSVPVTMGLYQFYIDQVPQTVRFHPMDESSELLVSEANAQVLQPMQKIYCDSMVEHPVTKVKFYRLQGFSDTSSATPGWVHDRQGDLLKLLDWRHVKSDTLLAYRLLKDETLRCQPNCSEDNKTKTTFKQGDIVVGDLLRASPQEKDNGPFLRLTDGSGWLFEKCSGFPTMIPVPIVTGRWILAVVNEPVGMMLRRQPVDSQYNVYEDKLFEFGELVECDRKIAAADNVNFYRVAGTNGWLFDSRNQKPMMKLLTEELRVTEEEKRHALEPWEPDFVRGIATTVSGVQETNFQEASAVLTFSTAQKVEVKVFCRTHTTCTSFSSFRFFECGITPSKLRVILRRDLAQTVSAQSVSAYQSKQRTDNKYVRDIQEEKKEDGTPALNTLDYAVGKDENEEDLRNLLMSLDMEIVRINDRRRELLRAIKIIENERVKEARRIQEETNKFMTKGAEKLDEYPNEQLNHLNGSNVVDNLVIVTAWDANEKRDAPEAETPGVEMFTRPENVAEPTGTKMPVSPPGSPLFGYSTSFKMPASPPMSPLSGCSSTLSNHVCAECSKEFTGKYSRDIHCREVHKLFCAVCDQIFLSAQEKQRHMLEIKHGE